MARSLALLLTAALLLPALPARGQDSCRLCYADPSAKPGERPLNIEIWADLSFAKLALTSRSEPPLALARRIAAQPARPARWKRGQGRLAHDTTDVARSVRCFAPEHRGGRTQHSPADERQRSGPGREALRGDVGTIPGVQRYDASRRRVL